MSTQLSQSLVELDIDAAWRGVISGQPREQRVLFAEIFAQAIMYRNSQRSPDEIARIERSKGLR